jgi:hypothetical protein
VPSDLLTHAGPTPLVDFAFRAAVLPGRTAPTRPISDSALVNMGGAIAGARGSSVVNCTQNGAWCSRRLQRIFGAISALPRGHCTVNGHCARSGTSQSSSQSTMSLVAVFERTIIVTFSSSVRASALFGCSIARRRSCCDVHSQAAADVDARVCRPGTLIGHRITYSSRVAAFSRLRSGRLS